MSNLDLWLSPHDFRVRSLKSLTYGFGRSPIRALGECVAVSTGSHLLALQFSDDRAKTLSNLRDFWPSVDLQQSREAEQLIDRGFLTPEKVAVIAIGTPFQLTIWEFLRTIPSASTMTYGEVALAIGRPQAARAVGQAVGANEIAMVIPCHRVVSLNSLAGYRWGLDRKRKLLAWELAKRDPLRMPF
jgi:AraC family transcriptional regulator of adaptative response/methylated-DNA-[protein]-cysteine methyltransferase